MLSLPKRPLTELTKLTQYEKAWQQMQPFLLENGYELRRRYQPGWVHSWSDGTWPESGWPEDSIVAKAKYFVDAVRSRTGERVGLKLVKLDEEIGVQELEIHEYLQQDTVRNDPRNPCIPLLEILHPPTHPNQCLLVMPLLYDILSPAFQHASECVEFVGQLLRGMEFLHEHNIAHKDICLHNVVMTAPGLYPKGCHPMNNSLSEDGLTYSEKKTRREVNPKYYFIDFGLSIKYGTPNERKETRIFRGMCRSVPEYERSGPWDGFKIDVYCMGILIHEEVVKGHIKMHFLKPLIKKMTRIDPSRRPTAQQAVVDFNRYISGFNLGRTVRSVLPFL
ncbi:kinase-like protein [Rickenella mellea]|uniref:Kinase-like protein n=1 Tax=Rickenella mellea TaxID=50990 RepID=A0A4Y7Q6B4_9AGAM|nr:kinase-like protein [Rickenella mellea]